MKPLNAVETEILHALAEAAGIAMLTTGELAPWCHSATDRTAVSRAAYNLRQAGLIEGAGEKPSHEGRGARPVVAYEITDAGLDAIAAHWREIADAGAAKPPAPALEPPPAADPDPDRRSGFSPTSTPPGPTAKLQPRQCATCQAYEPINPRTRDGAGECRRHATTVLVHPTVDGDKVRFTGVWPAVLPSDWCMEWL